ncbi:MAG: hypothetical protein WC807_04640 [Hyphomicrobium sp.]
MSRKMHRIVLPLVISATALAGCSASLGSTTASIFGGAKTADANAGTATPVATAQPAPPPSSPTSRALNVGAVTARALKCGYNFDPARLKAAFIANETAVGTPVAEIETLEKVYNVGLNGVNKVASTEEGYCSEKKTKEIKSDLNRLLAGDFTPVVRKAAQQDDGVITGLFGGNAGNTDDGVNTGPLSGNGF